MSIQARKLIDEGSNLAVPPRSRDERQAFASWLASALQFVGTSRGMLASRTRIPRAEIDAMLDDESNGTAKDDRTFVHDFILDVLERTEDSRITPGADPTRQVSDVVQGRAESATFFSPRDDLKAVIIALIEHARSEILIQAWQLGCPRMADALRAAGAETIQIAISARRGERIGSVLAELARDRDIGVFHDPSRRNHNKTIVADRKFLLTGSVNFNFGSGSCDENLLLTSRPEIVRSYAEDFDTKLRTRLREYGG